MPVAELIDRLQSERQEIALVAEGENVIGMVTITDLLETIAGQIEDPLDSRAGARESPRARRNVPDASVH